MKTTVEREARNANYQSQEGYIAPEVNIFETQDGYVLEAEMPGVNKDGLQITLEGNEITIVGRRATESIGGGVIHRERQTAAFRRVFELDPTIDGSRISAKIEQGVLTLTLPKSEKVKPKMITVS